MKRDRLLGILTLLQRRGRITMPELADRFEVSTRTISRDVEALCQAGFPIVTGQGKGGGVSLMPGFALDTTVFTRAELSALLTGLQSLDSVSRSPQSIPLTAKLGAAAMDETLSIDLSSFYKASLSDKIGDLRQAIRDRRTVTFRYYSPRGDAIRQVDPCRVLYRWSGWYLQGWCRKAQDFRLFKLLRLWELQVTEEVFDPHPLPEDDGLNAAPAVTSRMTDDYMITAVYEPTEKYRLVEEYGPGSFRELPDGRVQACWGFSSPDDAVRWFLSFGSRVVVTEPPEMVARMREEICRMLSDYPET